MIILIHGDDLEQSRGKLNELLAGKSGIIRIDFEKTTLDEISNAFESQDLFEEEKVVVIENVKNNNLFDEILPKLTLFKGKGSMSVILWTANTWDSKIISKLKQDQAYSFQLPKLLFPFLDTLSPKQGKKSVEILVKLRESMPDELIFYMIVKRIRLLLLLKIGKPVDFDETSKMQDWQLSRMSSQLNAWGHKELVLFYRKLFDLEIGVKTNSLPMSLSQHLDILLLSDLN